VPLLTFSLMWESKLMDLSKRQTIRINSDLWRRRAGRPDMMTGESVRVEDSVLHIHLTNPRNRHPRHRKMGQSNGWELHLMRGEDFTEDIALRDGFAGRQELVKGLMELNGMTYNEVMAETWAVIRWEWRLGPN